MFADLRNLAADTVRVFWRLLPQLLTIWLLGWLASTLAQRLSITVAEVSAWLGLAVFTFSFLFTLVAIVLILRLLGRELGIWDVIPAEESAGDDRDASLTQMLAVTLLPFLSVLAAFGQVSEAASGLAVEQTFRDPLGATTSVLGVVQGTARDHPWRLFLILAGLYVVRRVLDVLHERTGIRPLGLLVALVESFFILVVLFGGFVIARRVSSWIGNRAFAGWWDQFKDQLVRLLSALHVSLPALVERAWMFWTNEVWPAVWPVLSEPIIWLAVAALIYGSQVLSLAELWRKGQPLAARVPGASIFSRYADKRALRRQFRPPPRGVRWLFEEVRGAFFSDLDDKYLPTFHSLRLVLRAGAIFLGSYIAVYTAIVVIQNSVTRLIHGLTGGREVGFWYVADPFMNLADSLPWELLRLCLLAVTFRRCLVIFRGAGADRAPAGPPAAEPEPADVRVPA